MGRLSLASMFALFAPWLDAMDDWQPFCESEPGEREACLVDRFEADLAEGTEDLIVHPSAAYQVVDLEHAASGAKYRNGKNKRNRYPRVDLSERIVFIGLHQAGVERSERRWEGSAHRVTCHRAIGPAGNRYRVHPLDVRLVATNRADRAPYHTICIEVLGNFKGTPNGRHYKPERFGAGTLGLAQLAALREEIEAIIAEIEGMGGTVVGIIPHRTTGRNSAGRPNRQICCGYEIWSGAGEWAGAEHGLRVPSPDWSLGGLTIPEEWHGEHWPRCERFLAA